MSATDNPRPNEPPVECLKIVRARGRMPKEPEVLPDIVPHPEDIQGDVYYGFPRFFERFVFFRISNADNFKKCLQNFKPTSGADVHKIFRDIEEAKSKAPPRRVVTKQQQISFSRTGLDVLGIKEDTGDTRFDKRCMKDDRVFLGDQHTWDYPFDKKDFDEDKGSARNVDDPDAIHGVAIISTDRTEDRDNVTSDLFDIFGDSWSVPDRDKEKPKWILDGNARGRHPDVRHHEHFGFLDGISQPAMRGVTYPLPGQIQVNPGVIIMGYHGDPLLKAKPRRPSWAKGGSMMSFRKLKQDAVAFDKYCKNNGKYWKEITGAVKGAEYPTIPPEVEPELLAARLVGRWKSGAPLELCPFADNPELGGDAEKNNDFDYVVRDEDGVPADKPDEYKCPFTAHARKTVPRNLDPYVAREYLEAGAIAREATPYGDEITPEEINQGKDLLERGLLFNCYSSHLDSGFVRQTTGYGNNDYFPITGLKPVKHGQDPIIGGPPVKGSSGDTKDATLDCDLKQSFKDGDQVDILIAEKTDELRKFRIDGHVKAEPVSSGVGPEKFPFFVTSLGGEYFFVPSISTLNEWSGKKD